MVVITHFIAQCLAMISGARFESLGEGNFLTANGCKVYAHLDLATGTLTYRVSGYAHDGSDVARDLTQANDLARKIDSGSIYVGADHKGNLYPLSPRYCRNTLRTAFAR